MIKLSEKKYTTLQSYLPIGIGYDEGRPNINGAVYRNMAVVFLLCAQIMIWYPMVAVVISLLMMIEGLIRDMVGTHRSPLYMMTSRLMKSSLMPLVIRRLSDADEKESNRYAQILFLKGDSFDSKKEALQTGAKALSDAKIERFKDIESQITSSQKSPLNKWMVDQAGIKHEAHLSTNYMRKRLLDRMLWIMGLVVSFMLLTESEMYVIPLTIMSILALLEIAIGFCFPCWLSSKINSLIEIID